MKKMYNREDWADGEMCAAMILDDQALNAKWAETAWTGMAATMNPKQVLEELIEGQREAAEWHPHLEGAADGHLTHIKARAEQWLKSRKAG